MARKIAFIMCLIGVFALAGAPSATAETLLSDDFFYQEPTKPLGAIEGFQFQDYGGGFGSAWGGNEWDSVLNSTITGPDCAGVGGCVDPDDLNQGVVQGGSNRVLQRNYAIDGSAGSTIYFGGKIRNTGGADARSTIFLQGASVDDFNNFVELDAGSIGLGFTAGGGYRVILGDTPVEVSGINLTDDLAYHTLVGKLEINQDGNNERLTVWLDPTGEETGAESEFLDGVDVISDVTDLNSDEFAPFRLWTNAGISYFDDVAVGTTWDDVANVIVPRLSLEVDTNNGLATLKNDSASSLDLIFSSIESASGALLKNSWNSLADQGTTGWAENQSDSTQLVESVFSGSTTIAPGGSYSLGIIHNLATGTQDLEAEFGTAANLLNVTNVTFDAFFTAGDLNGDGNVDAADAGVMFANWGNGGAGDLNGDGLIDAADASTLFANWTGDSLAAVVPEAGTASLFVLGLLSLLGIRRRS